MAASELETELIWLELDVLRFLWVASLCPHLIDLRVLHCHKRLSLDLVGVPVSRSISQSKEQFLSHLILSEVGVVAASDLANMHRSLFSSTPPKLFFKHLVRPGGCDFRQRNLHTTGAG